MQIELKNLYKEYQDVHAVHGVNLSVPSNKILGIIGKSGAGKSTLVRLMSLLERPDSGEVWYGDCRVDSLDKTELIKRRRKIGMIFQNFNLFSSRSAGQNVAYPMEIAGYSKSKIFEKVRYLLNLVGLEDKINAPISTLSGGQKQRVSIARALSTEPEILFCDEATSALDPQTTRSILALIKDIQRQMNLTVVMITHQMEVVRDTCDYVAVLDGGVIVEENTTRGLFSEPKTEISKDFLSNISPNKDTEGNIILFSGRSGNYTLRFSPESTGRPVLSRIIKDYNVDFNILGAGIQNIENESYGNMVCDIDGSSEEVQKVIAALKLNGIFVEENLKKRNVLTGTDNYLNGMSVKSGEKSSVVKNEFVKPENTSESIDKLLKEEKRSEADLFPENNALNENSEFDVLKDSDRKTGRKNV